MFFEITNESGDVLNINVDLFIESGNVLNIKFDFLKAVKRCEGLIDFVALTTTEQIPFVKTKHLHNDLKKTIAFKKPESNFYSFVDAEEYK